jgi:methylenetetrahydrofolate dehydrogenase (NADP+)/methenyltetrahydrofolate cyclohydrolase
VLKICKSLRFNLDGANISVIGRSNIVGKPTAIAFEHENASVTMLHSHSFLCNIRRSVSESDIVVSATGKAGILNKFINADSVIIDCGFSFKDGHSCGDFDPSQVSETTLRQMSYTPTPHGTGVLTVCGLLENTIRAFKKRNHLE